MITLIHRKKFSSSKISRKIAMDYLISQQNFYNEIYKNNYL